MATRKLPLPDSMNPLKSSRPPPPLPSDSGPPPPLPSRRLPPPPPADSGPEPEQDEVYDDMEQGEIYEETNDSPSPVQEDVYDDATEGGSYSESPPLPPPPNQSKKSEKTSAPPTDMYEIEETTVQPPKIGRGPLPIPPSGSGRSVPPVPPPEESVYEVEPTVNEPVNTSNEGPELYEVVPDVKSPVVPPNRSKKGALPPTPPADDDQEEYDDFDVALVEDTIDSPAKSARPPLPPQPSIEQDIYDDMEAGEVYEAVTEEEHKPALPVPRPPAAPVPPPPVERQPKRPAAPLPQKKEKPPPVASGPSTGVLDLNAVLQKRNQLRSVGKPVEKEPPVEEKSYGEITDTRSAFEKFKLKGHSSPFGKTSPPIPIKPKPQIASISQLEKEKPSAIGGGVKGKLAFLENQFGSSALKPRSRESSEIVSGSSRSAFTQPASNLAPPVVPVKPHHSRTPSPEVENKNKKGSLPDPPSKEPLLPPVVQDRQSPSNHLDNLPPPPVFRSRSPSPPPPVPSSNRPGAHSYSQVSPKNVPNGNNFVPEDDDQDIYDDAMSQQIDPLLREPWFFQGLERKPGEEKLKAVKTNGTFLIRDSTSKSQAQPYTMMVLYNNIIFNLKIRVRDDGKIALGEEKPDEMSFMDVPDMVKYHRSNEVILVNKGKQEFTLLTKSPSK